VPGICAVLLVEAGVVAAAGTEVTAGVLELTRLVPAAPLVLLAEMLVLVDALEEVEEEVEEVLGGPAEIEDASTAVSPTSVNGAVSAKMVLTSSILTSWTEYPDPGVKPGVANDTVICVVGTLLAIANC